MLVACANYYPIVFSLLFYRLIPLKGDTRTRSLRAPAPHVSKLIKRIEGGGRLSFVQL